MFDQSLLNPAITSGRNANCFFQSFMHVFTHLPRAAHLQLCNNEAYQLPLHYFVESFNQTYANDSPDKLNFQQIIELSKRLHPLDRECIFGAVLRVTFNALVAEKLIHTEPLGFGENDIVLAHQTVAFANCFGARLSAYMTSDEFNKAKIGMTDDKVKSISENKINLNENIFVCDTEKLQPEVWQLNLVFAGAHLNYTLGTPERNQKQRDKVIVSISNQGAQYASAPADSNSVCLFNETQEIFATRSKNLFREAILLDLMKRTDILGISIATVNSKGIISTMPLGITDKDSTFVTPTTRFGVASLSKPVFAYLVLKLIAANKTNQQLLELGKFCLPNGLTHFDLDTPLFKICSLEGLSKNSSEQSKAKNLTARMVLLHVTGLPITHDNKKGSLKFQFEPNSEYGYSGIGFGYLQKVIEKLTQSNLEALAKKYVFKPLKMQHSSFIADKKHPKESHAANSLHSSPNDYLKFVTACINDKQLDYAFKPIVPLTADHWAFKMNVSAEDLKYIAWSLIFGLQINDKGHAIRAYCSGDMNNWRSWVAINLEDKTALVYFANSANGHILAEKIISPYVDINPIFNYFFPKYGSARKIEDNWQAMEKARYQYIGEYLESRNEPSKLSILLSTRLGLFRMPEKELLLAQKDDNDKLSQEYDKCLG